MNQPEIDPEAEEFKELMLELTPEAVDDQACLLDTIKNALNECSKQYVFEPLNPATMRRLEQSTITALRNLLPATTSIEVHIDPVHEPDRISITVSSPDLAEIFMPVPPRLVL